MMDFSAQHSFFSTPLPYWKSHDFRSDHIRKRKNVPDDDPDEYDRDNENGSSPNGVTNGEVREGNDGEPSEAVRSGPKWTAVNSTQVGDTGTYNSTLLEETEYPTRPKNPRLETRSRRAEYNLNTLAQHNIFIPRKPTTLRARHLTILNTILHKSILTRDWPRAKRAFGLLIREEWVDVRKIWMVGADILFQSGDGREQQFQQSQNNRNKQRGKAKEYLDRLVVQYPYTQSRWGTPLPVGKGSEFTTFKSVRKEDAYSKQQRLQVQGKSRFSSAVDFFPVVVGLLIISSNYCSAINAAQTQTDNANPTEVSMAESMKDGYYLSPVATDDLFSPSHPQKIKANLEEQMIAPPWSDDFRLWCLRGMICLWMADLEVVGIPPNPPPKPKSSDGVDIQGGGDDGEEAEESEAEPDEDELINMKDGYETPASMRSEGENEDEVGERRRDRGKKRNGIKDSYRQRRKKSKKLLEEAEACFERVKALGGSVPEIVSRALRGVVAEDGHGVEGKKLEE